MQSGSTRSARQRSDWLMDHLFGPHLRVKMIEIALGILATQPRDDKALRSWAVDVLDRHSKAVGVPLSPEAKDELLKRALPIALEAVGIAAGSATVVGWPWLRGAGATGNSAEIFETPTPMRAKDDEAESQRPACQH
jgi:hypothetical protein